jgi:hypothetical protein
MSQSTLKLAGQGDPAGGTADFSPSAYRDLLRAFHSAGYRSASFDAVAPREPQLLLRHDVDLSLEEAHKIAEIDAAEDWRATVFVLIASEFYNVFTHAGRTAVLDIMRLGHEIGLHFDGSVYNDGAPPAEFTPELEAAARRECDMLENLIGVPVRTLSFHRPRRSPWILGRPGRFADRLQAYAPEFFADIAYVADSAGSWSEGHPLDHPAFHQRRAMQATMHPYLWTQPARRDRVEKIDTLRQERARFLLCEARRNFSFYPR